MTRRDSTNLGSLDAALSRLRIKSDDDTAWCIIYRRLWSTAFAVSFKALAGNCDLAEDAAQESFVRLARQIGRPSREGVLQSPGSIRAYLSRAARSAAIDALRAQTRIYVKSAALHEDHAAKGGLVQSRFHGSNHFRQAIDALGAELNPTDRELLRLVVTQPSTGEIARMLGLPYSRTAVRISRLKDKLRKLLAERDLYDFHAGETTPCETKDRFRR